jgi:hypothetical protein
MSRMHAVTRYSLTTDGVQGKMTRRLAGVVLGTQGLAVFFGALAVGAQTALGGRIGLRS